MSGSGGVTLLTPKQIYLYMVGAGFPTVVAVTMTAIALRESGGNGQAFNGNPATGDESYGLLQINLMSDAVVKELQEHLPEALKGRGTPESTLLEPDVNARAGFVLWGGSNGNLNVAWYIDRAGPPNHYQERYEANLPVAQRAALGV